MTSRRPARAATLPRQIPGIALATTLLLAACSASPVSTPTVAPLPTVAATVVPTAATTVAPSPSPAGPPPSPTPVSGTAACDPANLAASITSWQGAAGHMVATISLINNGKSNCTIHVLATPQLVDANAKVLIQGTPPTSAATMTLAYYDIVTTMIQDANYCGPTPTGPVTVAFVFPGGEGRLVAMPAAGNPLAGVPPCLGPAGSAGDIEMHPFAP